MADFRRYAFGVVVCANGDVYYYKQGFKSFTDKYFEDIVTRNRWRDGLSIEEARFKALDFLAEECGIEWRKL